MSINVYIHNTGLWNHHRSARILSRSDPVVVIRSQVEDNVSVSLGIQKANYKERAAWLLLLRLVEHLGFASPGGCI